MAEQGSNDLISVLGPHRPGDLPLPPCPTADYIVLSADVALRGFKTALHQPAGAGHVHGLGQCGGSAGQRRPRPSGPWGHSRCAVPTASGATPAASGRPRAARASPPTGALGASTRTVPCPAVGGHGRKDRFDVPLLPPQPDIRFPRDGQGIGPFLRLPPPPPPPIIAIDAVARHPGGRHPRLAGLLQPALAQRRRRGQRSLGGNPRPGAGLTIRRPRLGQRAFPVKQGVPSRTSIGGVNK